LLVSTTKNGWLLSWVPTNGKSLRENIFFPVGYWGYICTKVFIAREKYNSDMNKKTKKRQEKY